MPPKLGQIVESILYTSDTTKLAEWYKDVMGLKPFIELPAVVGFNLPNNTLLLLFDRARVTEDRVVPGGMIPKHGSPIGLGQHIAFACSGPEELKEWTDHFREKNVTILAETTWEKGGKSVYVKDWEGHVIEVMTTGVWEVY
ncbi:putative glyoxalase family protein [Thozetella sp. PMI_491]|nr:putative glyoxalase family protein [Thozetella sp. PMI_491]